MMTIRQLVAKVYRTLGPGYTESIYHNALEVLLRKNHINYETERIIPIVFEDHVIGNLRADLIVEGSVIVELKSTRTLTDANRTQIQTYMHLLGITDGLLVNFGSERGLQMEQVSGTHGQFQVVPSATTLDLDAQPPSPR
jgi:GxxExxY protein